MKNNYVKKRYVITTALLLALAGLFSPTANAENITDGLPKITAADIAKWHGINCFIIDLPEDIDGKFFMLYTTDQDGKKLRTSSYYSGLQKPGERIKLLMKLNDDRDIEYQFIAKRGNSGVRVFDIGLPKNVSLRGSLNSGMPHVSGNIIADYILPSDNGEVKEIRIHFGFKARPGK